MDKPLSDKDKKATDPTQEKAGQASGAEGGALPVSGPDTSKLTADCPYPFGQAMGAYSLHNTRPLVTREAWNDTSAHIPWADDPKRRLAIRMFSRGVLGAAFFAAGGIIARKWLHGYDPTKTLGEQANCNPLKFIAKLIDEGVGKPIEATVGAIAGKEAGMAAVHFRPTYFGRIAGKEMRGRSLGNEVVNVTFDFFCASVGDAWGRDIAGWFDPSVKKEWMDDKGHINIPKAIRTAIDSTLHYVTYNGGEDWAVAIPYVYFMKGQRALINHASPGFAYDFDRNLNGGSFRLKDNKIVGNYQLPGLIDLQSRFTVYNIGTLMFRETYNHVANRLAGKPDSFYGAPDCKPERKGVLETAGDLLKWVARSTVKGMIIMTPAVPFFWITRTPQSQHKGAFIDPEKGMLGTGPQNRTLYANSPPLDPNTQLKYLEYVAQPSANRPGNYDSVRVTPNVPVQAFEPALAQPHPRYLQENSFNAYGRKFGGMDPFLNPIGKANYKFANTLDGAANWMDNHSGYMMGVPHGNVGGFQNFTRPMLYAAASYTPYMYAKAEFANLWDNGKMDMAAERMIDGAVGLNWGEFKAGAGEVWRSILRQPLDDPKREAEAKRRMLLDTTPADVFTKTQAGMFNEMKDARERGQPKAAPEGTKDQLSWQERVISGKPPEKKTEPAAARPKNYAEQEAMRKALEELNPPTNSIN